MIGLTALSPSQKKKKKTEMESLKYEICIYHTAPQIILEMYHAQGK